MHKRVLAVGIALAVMLLAPGLPGRAAPPSQGQAIISSPASGSTLSGVVQITGVAAHPSILWYEVHYASGPVATAGTQWILLAHVDNTSVQDGVLATWDTTALPNGQYCLVLTVVGRDDSFTYQVFATYLTVNNTQPVVSPTLEQPTPLPLPTAIIGPTATPVTVEQPPTVTPRSSPVPGAEGEGTASSPAGEEGRSRLVFDTEGMRSAFCTGGLVVLLLFVLLGLYQLTKALIRWYLRGRRPL